MFCLADVVQGMNNFSKSAREMFVEIQKIDSNYYPEVCLGYVYMLEHLIWLLH
jgi:hypothetical protein